MAGWVHRHSIRRVQGQFIALGWSRLSNQTGQKDMAETGEPLFGRGNGKPSILRDGCA